jgi:hypothetical protein
MREATTRIALSRRELLLIRSFVENVDQDAWNDRLMDKLERAIARIDGTEPPPLRSVAEPVASPPDQCRAICRVCGWHGTLTKASPCPTCGQKVNPLLFDGKEA